MGKSTKLTDLQWSKVELLQERSFHGAELSLEDQKLCMKAYHEDAERYRKRAEAVREDYKKSLQSF